ncbi:MAG TPA: SDR family oxidoreductase [Longimicrobiaceae bacterium]|nr:SDR family oxidoreductase [Longimicrobiaceae bacterium]
MMGTGRLEGKTAVITGGNSGIGLATAQEFVEQGARVLITGRDQATLDSAVAGLGDAARAVRADVGRMGELELVAAAARDFLGHVDVLFVNAGIGKFAPVELVDEAGYDEIFDVNVKGAYFTVQSLLPLLSDGASVILNGSVSGLIGMAGSSVYSASKAAIRSLARTFSADLTARRIRVNVVSPGPVTTPILGRMGLPQEALEETAEGIRQMVPLKRFADVGEIAKTVLFLASDDSTFILGSELVVDGGIVNVEG